MSEAYVIQRCVTEGGGHERVNLVVKHSNRLTDLYWYFTKLVLFNSTMSLFQLNCSHVRLWEGGGASQRAGGTHIFLFLFFCVDCSNWPLC